MNKIEKKYTAIRVAKYLMEHNGSCAEIPVEQCLVCKRLVFTGMMICPSYKLSARVTYAEKFLNKCTEEEVFSALL